MNTPDARLQLSRMISGYWISQAVYVAAKLKIADLLSQRPQPLSELAHLTKTHQPSLYPHMQGILFDLPHVIERAKANLKSAGVADRCQTVSGNFFESVPSGVDALLMRHIIHDWDDDKATTILRNCHPALNDNGRVLIVESVIAPGNEPSFAKLLDLTMMVLPGGKERTAIEYQRLLEASGFELTQIILTSCGVSIIEGRRIG